MNSKRESKLNSNNIENNEKLKKEASILVGKTAAKVVGQGIKAVLALKKASK